MRHAPGSSTASAARSGRLGSIDRGTVGLIVNRFELYGGYEGRRIGKVSLHGPTLGLRAWF